MIDVIARNATCLAEMCLMGLACLYISFSFYNILKINNIYARCLVLYLLIIIVYYYIILLKKSPGSVSDYEGIQIKGICKHCKRYKCNRTYHCSTCNKCYYKRDHHCPWLGKCIAAKNYREFYLLLLFSNMYLTIFVFTSPNKEIRFVNCYLLIIFFIFFIWTNFLLIINKTSIEFYKGRRRNQVIEHSINFNEIKESIYTILCENDSNNAIILFFPFLKKKTRIITN
ncbi:Palmitoyltransferase pfa3 [Astathelohania contejeani]|uniref:Palmitoyltransferase n=1 Tax=Astathelohania contejeani TaxID=164912 RepID=A0ABQ7HYQ8_9MICR|nr:Palmitoyltransferase pfa3 [Thelohania contejeani]